MPEHKLRETSLLGNVWVFTLGGDSIATSYGANCTAVIGGAAVLLTDPLIAPAYARLIEIAVQKRTDKPIRFVLLTHHHTDHALGAGYVASRGASVLAHRACRERMAAEHADLIEERRRKPEMAHLFADAKPYLPAVIFENGLTLDLGDTPASVIHPGHGHAAGDAVVHLPRESLVICGDLVSAGYHVNYEDAAVENLDRSLKLLAELAGRIYIPGHGAAGGAELIDAQRRYHAAAKDTAEQSSDPKEMIERLRSRFPGHLLGEVIPAARPAWRKGRGSKSAIAATP